MKRALLKGALAALAVLAMAIPASASSHARSSSYDGQEWMDSVVGNGASHVRASRDRVSTGRSAKGRHGPHHARANTDTAPRHGRRHVARSNYEDGGSAHSGQSGLASYYWEPQRLASGGWFNPNGMTAAHKTLPFGTKVRITHQGSGRSVTVTINDRGPYVAGRIIDLSSAAAGALGIKGAGVAHVSLAVLGR